MTLLCAIDAGLRRCGVSVFCSGRLVRAWRVVSPERVVRGPRAWKAMAAAVLDEVPFVLDALIVEQMQYDGRTEGKAADVLEVSGVVNALIVGLGRNAEEIHCPRPNDWKGGSVPKAVTQARLKAALSPDECVNVETWDHNVQDAMSIGLWAVRRRGERR
jgi:hypothetical protein